MQTEEASTTYARDYRVNWVNRSEGYTPTSQIREFDSKYDAWNFASQLSSFGGNLKITVQIRVGEDWVPVLGFTSPHWHSSIKESNFQ